MDLTYHKDIGFPAWFKKPTCTFRPHYTAHAVEAAQDDGYGPIAVPETIDLTRFEVIEMTVAAGTRRVVKMLIRGQHDGRRDIVMPVTADGRVKTVWANLRTDIHRTLDRSKYARP